MEHRSTVFLGRVQYPPSPFPFECHPRVQGNKPADATGFFFHTHFSSALVQRMATMKVLTLTLTLTLTLATLAIASGRETTRCRMSTYAQDPYLFPLPDDGNIQLMNLPKAVDVNLDGFLDIVGVAHYSKRILWWPNQGDFTFGSPVLIYASPSSTYGTIGAGDWNNDGLTDLVAVGRTAANLILLKDPAPASTFASPVTINLYSSNDKSGIMVLDINGDGALDFVTTDWSNVYTSRRTIVFINANDGTGENWSAYGTTVGRQAYHGGPIGDYDGDGDYDFVPACTMGGSWSVYQNAGSNTSWAAGPAMGSCPCGSVLVDSQYRPGNVISPGPDFNGDGRPDVPFACGIAFNDGLGGFDFVPFPSWAATENEGSYADIDQDGDLDVIKFVFLPLISAGELGVLYNMGNGTFSPPRMLYREISGTYLRNSYLVDLDQDGDLDLVVTGDDSGNDGDDTIVVMQNRNGWFRTTCVDPACTTGACLAAAVETAGNTYSSRIELANTTYTSCPITHMAVPLMVDGRPLNVTVDLSTTGRAIIDCAHAGVTFSVGANAHLHLENVDIRRTSTSFTALPLPGLYASTGSRVDMINVTITDASSSKTYAGAPLVSSTVCGGALAVAAGATVTTRDVVFAGNTASGGGGAICLRPQPGMAGTPTLEAVSTTFESNTAGTAGGHVVVVVEESNRGGSATFVDCVLDAGVATAGGALAAYVDTVLVTDNDDAASISPEPPNAALSLSASAHAPALVIDASTVIRSGEDGGLYGDVFFLCSAVASMAGTLEGTFDPAQPPVFICVPDSNTAPVPSWLDGPGATGVLSTGWSPPALAVAVPANTLLMAGKTLSVSIELFTVYNKRYELATTLVGIDVETVAPSECVPQIVRRITTPITGAVTTLSLPVSASGASCLDRTHTLRGGVVTALAAPYMFSPQPALSVAIDVTLTRCSPGSGPASFQPFACDTCGVGTYTDDSFSGIEACALFPTCPANTERGILAESGVSVPPPCSCVRGTYSPTRELDTVCLPCPEGGECAGGLELPVAAVDWYDVGNTTGKLVQIEQCLRPTSCAGGSTCYPGSTGFMCTACESGYFTSATGSCAKCTDGMVMMFWGFVVVALALVILVLAFGVGAAAKTVSMSDRQTSLVQSEEEWARTRVPRALATGLLFAQCLAVITRTSLIFPTPIRETLETLTVLNFSLTYVGGECVLLSFTTGYKFAILAPAVLVLLTLGITCVAKLIVPARIPSIVRVVERVVFTTGPVLYIAASQSALQLFDCTKLPSGDYVLDADLGFECFTSAWFELLPWALFAVVFYVAGLPLFMALSLFSVRHSLASPAARARYGLLYRLYKPDFYQFEVLLLGKRLGIVMAVMFFSRIVVWLFTCLVAVFSIFAAVQLRFGPFVVGVYNSLETRLNISLLIILTLGLLFSSSEFPNDTSYYIFVVAGMLVVVASFVYIGWVAMTEVFWRGDRQANKVGTHHPGDVAMTSSMMSSDEDSFEVSVDSNDTL